MGNAITQGTASSFCSFKILPAKTLSKSSLGRLSEKHKHKSPVSANVSTSHSSATKKKIGNSSPKDLPDSPETRGFYSPNCENEKHFSLTENHFHIFQVLSVHVIINI